VPRRGFIAKREVLPDPLYASTVVTRLINNIMLDGKRVLRRRLFTALLTLSRKKPVRNRLMLLIRLWKTSCPC